MKHLRLITIATLSLLFALPSVAQTEKKALKYWGSPENYLNAQGIVLLETVDQAMDLYKPTTEFSFERKQALLNFDTFVHNTYYDNSKLLVDFVVKRMGKVLADLEAPIGKENVRIYKIYNDGFIIRTAKATIAVDLNGRHGAVVPDAEMEKLVSHCDALFITHNHADHYDLHVVDMFLKQGKQVHAVPNFQPGNEAIDHVRGEEPIDVAYKLPKGKLKVRIYPGHQDQLLCNVYVFTMPNGVKIAHTGDQYNEEDMAWIKTVKNDVPDLDVLIVECWIHHLPEVIDGFSPKVVVTGHEDELGHTIDHREAFWLTYYKFQEVYNIQTPYVIMGWGEWYDYR